MRLWRVLAGFGIVAAVLAGLLIYDGTRSDRVAEGVRVGSLDLGGMSRGEAVRAVRARFGRAVAQPVVVTYKGRRFTLGPAGSGARIDAGAPVDRAIARSRGGNPFGRALRALTDGSVDAVVAPVV